MDNNKARKAKQRDYTYTQHHSRLKKDAKRDGSRYSRRRDRGQVYDVMGTFDSSWADW